MTKPTQAERVEAMLPMIPGLDRNAARLIASKIIEADPLTQWADDIVKKVKEYDARQSYERGEL